MNVLGNGLYAACHYEDVLAVREAEISMLRRLGDSESNILATQGNLANTYEMLGREQQALQMRRDMYSGCLKLHGEEHEGTLGAAFNYAASLMRVKRPKEAKSLMRRQIPVAQRVLGEGCDTTLRMKANYAAALVNAGATLDDLREAVTTLEDAGRTAKRVLGGAHPTTVDMGENLRVARAALRAREDTQP